MWWYVDLATWTSLNHAIGRCVAISADVMEVALRQNHTRIIASLLRQFGNHNDTWRLERVFQRVCAYGTPDELRLVLAECPRASEMANRFLRIPGLAPLTMTFAHHCAVAEFIRTDMYPSTDTVLAPVGHIIRYHNLTDASGPWLVASAVEWAMRANDVPMLRRLRRRYRTLMPNVVRRLRRLPPEPSVDMIVEISAWQRLTECDHPKLDVFGWIRHVSQVVLTSRQFDRLTPRLHNARRIFPKSFRAQAPWVLRYLVRKRKMPPERVRPMERWLTLVRALSFDRATVEDVDFVHNHLYPPVSHRIDEELAEQLAHAVMLSRDVAKVEWFVRNGFEITEDAYDEALMDIYQRYDEVPVAFRRMMFIGNPNTMFDMDEIVRFLEHAVRYGDLDIAEEMYTTLSAEHHTGAWAGFMVLPIRSRYLPVESIRFIMQRPLLAENVRRRDVIHWLNRVIRGRDRQEADVRYLVNLLETRYKSDDTRDVQETFVLAVRRGCLGWLQGMRVSVTPSVWVECYDFHQQLVALLGVCAFDPCNPSHVEDVCLHISKDAIARLRTETVHAVFRELPSFGTELDAAREALRARAGYASYPVVRNAIMFYAR